MIKTIRKGIEIFGNKENFREWLCSPNIAMGGNMPIAYDWELIYDVLGRIEHGVFA